MKATGKLAFRIERYSALGEIGEMAQDPDQRGTQRHNLSTFDEFRLEFFKAF
jgi:hypothetical protein